MSESVIRVLRHGKDTQTRLQFNNGVTEHAIVRVGAGRFLPGEFSEVSDARDFADSELQKDPAAILYIVKDAQILDTLMNQEYQSRRDKRDRIIYAVISTAAVVLVALCVSLFAMPFISTHAHVLFTGGMALLYVALLVVFGTRNIHALAFIGIIMVMILFLAPAIKDLLSPDKAPQTTTRNVAQPRH